MPTMELKSKQIANLKPPKSGRLELWDRLVPGFGLRITPEATRSFFLMFRVDTPAGRQRRRLKLGEVYVPPHDGPALPRDQRPNHLTLGEAREAAREALEQVALGIDPAAQKPQPTGGNSVAAVAEDYLGRYVKKHCASSTYRETARIFTADVIPGWGSRPIGTISRRDVGALIDTIAQRGAEVQANRVLARLKTFFAWAESEEVIPASPIVRMKPHVREVARDRVLTDDEVRLFWRSCGMLGWPFDNLFRLLLVTAQRRDEVGGIRLGELDLERRLWVIPKERAKNGRANEVAVSDLALEVIDAAKAARPKIAAIMRSDLTFTSTGITPVSGFSRAKLRLDHLMEQLARKDRGLPEDEAEYRKALKLKPSDPLPRLVPDWILHDLRRTAATGMARLNVPPHVVDKILNHVEGTISGVAAIYNRFGYGEERAAALQAWGCYISALIRPAADNVVKMRG